jgi:hypothetical protein
VRQAVLPGDAFPGPAGAGKTVGMASTTIPRAITRQEAADKLQKQLGSRYEVSPHGDDALTVKQGIMTYATVHLGQDQDATTFRVHGGGLIIGRLINELTIARTVTAAIKESLGPTAGNGGQQS